MKLHPALALVFLPVPAAAWTFSPLPVCTLSHDEPGLGIVVTFDPSQEQPYAIALTRTDGVWPDADRFALAFTEPLSMTITTTRHTRSTDGRTLSVTDTGFGNVLDGLQFAGRATALSGELALQVPLAGASPAVAAFRSCGVSPSV